MAKKRHTKCPRRRPHLGGGGGVEGRVDKIARDNQSDHEHGAENTLVVEGENIASNEPNIEDENTETD